jgi:hypothetical protein
MEFIYLSNNKIQKIKPTLFDNLYNLKSVEISGSNKCVDKNFGCMTCSIDLSELKSGLSTCFWNCLSDDECAKSQVELLENNDQNPTILSNQIQILQENLMGINETCKSHDSEITTVKITVDNFQKIVENSEKTCKFEVENLRKTVESAANKSQFEMKILINKYIEQFNRSIEKVEENWKITKENLIESNEKTMNDFKEQIQEPNEVLSMKFSEAKVLMENERLRFELKEAKLINEKLMMELEMEKLKKKIHDLEARLERQEENSEKLEEKFHSQIDAKLEAFKIDLHNENRP